MRKIVKILGLTALILGIPTLAILIPKQDDSSAVASETQSATQQVKNTIPTFQLLNHKTGKVSEISQSDYVKGVVAAEMPISFEPEALKAQEMLKLSGINVRVIDIHTIKPIDKELIVKCAKETGKVITVEDHSIIGGLGTAVCEVLSEEYPIKVIRMGIPDCFGKSGKATDLMKYFRIDAQAIYDKVVRELE